uniref:Ribonuclease H2 subunit B wHTH domain-containing protein n=1 Tax=Chromera velia CCMP2878 TaxID=1169474 RepID=A0A0G4FEV7_9ALVE|eukprot:Cvel_16574.t1-p1 / transcript=Cvel_16574.t1 / gene=Cvel_16574 / organism=Chromera_velia_CCMP2878 / gene_product=hypothetical protein / transcript_product=hypothetical protein / location=Cvel_scaffold1282:45848-46831(-) / protein_length=328 / sequence_SO=supercontig / SO=protein_coding / is_pseudo=false
MKMQHPRSKGTALFMLQADSKSTELFELQVAPRGHGTCSAFVGDEILSDGSLTVASPFDPLFLFLPFLLSSDTAKALSRVTGDSEGSEGGVLCEGKEKEAFVVLEDAVRSLFSSLYPKGSEEEKLSLLLISQLPSARARVEAVCDSTELLGRRMIRLSVEKLQAELRRKMDRLMKRVREGSVEKGEGGGSTRLFLPEFMYATSVQMSSDGGVEGTYAVAEKDAMRSCFALLSCLLPESMRKKAREWLDVPPPEDKGGGVKRQLEEGMQSSEGNVGRDWKENDNNENRPSKQQKQQETRQKPGPSKAPKAKQIQPPKGTKLISSFFKKK